MTTDFAVRSYFVSIFAIDHERLYSSQRKKKEEKRDYFSRFTRSISAINKIDLSETRLRLLTPGGKNPVSVNN